MRLIADMLGQLDLHRPLDQPLGQLRQKPAGPGDLLLGPGALEQLVEHLIREPAAIAQRPDRPAHPRAHHRVVDQLGREPARARRDQVPREGAQRFASASLRSPDSSLRSLVGLAALSAGETLIRAQTGTSQLTRIDHDRILGTTWRFGSRRHDDAFRSCLHKSSDNPRARGRALLHSSSNGTPMLRTSLVGCRLGGACFRSLSGSQGRRSVVVTRYLRVWDGSGREMRA